jgi:hypothetical protein
MKREDSVDKYVKDEGSLSISGSPTLKPSKPQNKANLPKFHSQFHVIAGITQVYHKAKW